MLVCLLYALVLGALSAAVAIASFRLAAKEIARPGWARLVGGALGAVAGGLLARPLVELAVVALGHRAEAAGMMAAFTFPFFLPMNVAIGGWLFSEVVGGRSSRPFRALGAGFGCALLGAAAVLIPLYFYAQGPSKLVNQLAIIGVPSALCVVGIWLVQRRHGEA